MSSILNMSKHSILRYGLWFLALTAIFTLFNILSCSLPDRKVKERIEEASIVLHRAGNYSYVFPGVEASRMDNFTDALILNQIYNLDRHHPIRSSMRMVRKEKHDQSYDQTTALYELTHGNDKLTESDYARYWHGSTSLYRCILTITSYRIMQWLMIFAIAILWCIFLFRYYPRGGFWKCTVLPISWLLVYGFLMPISLQFFPVLAIALVSSILVMKKDQDIPLLFFITASVTCFFDLLTIPLITFGWPLVVWLSLQNESKFDWKKSSLEFICNGVAWVSGYALTFAAKWLIASGILGINILEDAAGAVSHRISAEDFTRWDAIAKNFDLLPTTMLIITILTFIIVSALHFRSNGKWKTLFFFLVGLTPYMWYLVLSNHSYLHCWFTYRLQAVTIAALLMVILSSHSGKWRFPRSQTDN